MNTNPSNTSYKITTAIIIIAAAILMVALTSCSSTGYTTCSAYQCIEN
jgi:hypothetical protein